MFEFQGSFGFILRTITECARLELVSEMNGLDDIFLIDAISKGTDLSNKRHHKSRHQIQMAALPIVCRSDVGH